MEYKRFNFNKTSRKLKTFLCQTMILKNLSVCSLFSQFSPAFFPFVILTLSSETNRDGHTNCNGRLPAG